MTRKLSALLLFILLSSPAALAAGGFSIPISDKPVGGAIVDGANFGMVGIANRSYLCAITVGDADYSLSNSIISPSGAPITGIRPVSSAEATRYLGRLVGAAVTDVDSKDNLVFFVAPNGANEYGKYTFTIGINSGTPSYLSVGCIETSIICEFNTYLSQLNFLEVTNLGSSSAVANLKLIDSTGSESTIGNAFTFPAGLRRDVDIHTPAGANHYGYILLQAVNFAPSLDQFTNPKVSTYKNGQIRSSVQCNLSPGLLLD